MTRLDLYRALRRPTAAYVALALLIWAAGCGITSGEWAPSYVFMSLIALIVADGAVRGIERINNVGDFDESKGD